MGQSLCSNVDQQSFARDTLMFQHHQQQSLLNNTPQTSLNFYLQNEKHKIKKITLIQNNEELIYEYDDYERTIEKLSVKSWIKEEMFDEIVIQDFIDERTCIVRVRKAGGKQQVWIVLMMIQVENVESRGMIDYGVAYIAFNRIKTIYPSISPHFVYADQSYFNLHSDRKTKATFIIQSQPFNSDIVSLRNLGQYMRKNDIFWQDKEFYFIIMKCRQIILKMHDEGLMAFEEFLIDRNGEVLCVGGLVEEGKLGNQADLRRDKNNDFVLLGIYLIETLYGKPVAGFQSTQQSLKFIQSQERECKFKHPQTIQLLSKLIKSLQAPTKNLFNPKTQSISPLSNIPHYIDSYRIKQTLPPSFLLSQRYINLSENFKAKQVLFQKLSSSLYNQEEKTSILGEIPGNEKFSKLLRKMSVSKSQLEECFEVVEEIVRLERKFVQNGAELTQLDGLIKEYVNLGITLAYNARKGQDFSKAITILEKIQQFLQNQNESWLLNLHLGECYLLVGRLDEAQNLYKRSIKYEINEANVCFFIKFYTAVLNWQKAITLLRSYEGLIVNDCIYDFLIAKILLSKALCISPKLKENQQQRNQVFYDCISVAGRVLDRKNIPETLLCESYEILGDAHFYLKEYERSQEFYEKGLALSRSIEYSCKKGSTKQQSLNYDPTYIRKGQQEYSRSLTPHKMQSSSFKRASSKKSANHSVLSVGSLISQAEFQQSSFFYQLKVLHNFDKKAILLSSIANCKFMQANYRQAIKLYEEARNAMLVHNLDLKNSIIGNMAICSMEMRKKDPSQIQKQQKFQEGKQLLKHIIDVTVKQSPSKMQNDVNYIFLLNELEAAQ